MTANPYADAFDAYWRAGWRGVLPLPYRRKQHPPTGHTGITGDDPSYPDCQTWADSAGPSNIALRLPDDVIGIDVDHYGDKRGGDVLAGLEAQHGPLPPTVLSTARADGVSGIRYYRVPRGTVLPGMIPGGIEFIQRHHRYAVVWPSIHPEGMTYRWIDQATGAVLDDAPALDALPELPAPWVAALAVIPDEHVPRADVDIADVNAIVAGLPPGEPCRHILAAAGKALAGGSRHDAYLGATMAVVGLAWRGCPGGAAAIKRLGQAFVSEITDRARPGEAAAEFTRGLHGALRIVAATPRGNVCPDEVDTYVATLISAPADPAPDGVDPETGEIAAAPADSAFDRAVTHAVGQLLVADRARQVVADMKAGEAPPLVAVDLATFLAQPDEDAAYRIVGLWPIDGRALLVAAAKSGKTTMLSANLIPSLVDGRPFLGRYEPTPVSGRVVLLNMEVSDRTLRGWMRRARIDNLDRVHVVNLRGRAGALNLSSPAGRQRLGAWLRGLDAEVVILDPLAPVLASLGLDENSNADVAAFFSWWSEAMHLGGVRDDLIAHHAGHAGERSRGASRLLDEPDAIWTLTKEKDKDGDEDDPFGRPGARVITAYGRDVELAATVLSFDPATSALTLTGMGPREYRGDTLVRLIIEHLEKVGTPQSRNAVAEAIGGKKETVLAAIRRELERPGTRLIETDQRVGGANKITVDPTGSHRFPPVPDSGTTTGSLPYREPVELVREPVAANHTSGNVVQLPMAGA